jgi:hypothetical protein
MVCSDDEVALQPTMATDDTLASAINIGFHTVDGSSDNHRTKIILCVSFQCHHNTGFNRAMLVTIDAGDLRVIHNGVDTINIRAGKRFVCNEIIYSILDRRANSPINKGHDCTDNGSKWVLCI